ncbi:MAG TPA: hypothetical protein VLA12_14570 [Planctomycetaceae bacterium]|nr:hypothetical protein [Planctomycetaceae bacterium]
MKTIKIAAIAAMIGALLTGTDNSAFAGNSGKKSSPSFKGNQSFSSSRSAQSRFRPSAKSFGNSGQSQIPKFNPVNNPPKSKPFVQKPFPGSNNGTPILNPVKPLSPIKLVKPGIGNPTVLPFPGIGTPKPFPPIKPIDPGIGNGKLIVKPNPHGPGHGHGHGHHQHGKHFHLWLGAKSHHCHWWFHYCPTIVTYSPTVYVPCRYDYIVCDYRVNEEVAFPNVKFRLGVTGLFLPGKGMGIEKVEENSPADLNGLKPGMVIAKCNGVLIDNEEAFLKVMKTSNGVLDLAIVVSETEEPVELTIDLRSAYSQP